MLILANKTKKTRLSLFNLHKKEIITIPKVSSFKFLIFCILTLVSDTLRLSILVISKYIIVTLMFESKNVWTNNCPTNIRYYIQKIYCSFGLGFKGFILSFVTNIEVFIIYNSFLTIYESIY